jgi:hypothetical protein
MRISNLFLITDTVSFVVFSYGTTLLNIFLKFSQDPDPIFLSGLNPDPVPTGIAKSSGSSSGSGLKYSLQHSANILKIFSWRFKAYRPFQRKC